MTRLGITLACLYVCLVLCVQCRPEGFKKTTRVYYLFGYSRLPTWLTRMWKDYTEQKAGGGRHVAEFGFFRLPSLWTRIHKKFFGEADVESSKPD